MQAQENVPEVASGRRQRRSVEIRLYLRPLLRGTGNAQAAFEVLADSPAILLAGDQAEVVLRVCSEVVSERRVKRLSSVTTSTSCVKTKAMCGCISALMAI